MTINGKIKPTLPTEVGVKVAIAVLSFGEQFLLARRHAYQHQGDKLEFVGGKLEASETPQMALVREVKEEIGIDVADNTCIWLGRIVHDYTDKIVILYVYRILLNERQYQILRQQKLGLDGQAIDFYDKAWLLTHEQALPPANKAILTWLTLPFVVVVSRALAMFDGVAGWVAFYADKLPQGALLSVRLQADNGRTWQAISALHHQRPDIVFVVPWRAYADKPADFAGEILALRLTHDELMAQDISDVLAKNLFDGLPIIASCHDELSLVKANLCARALPMLGVFLSPVLPTTSHPDTPNLGWERFAQLAQLSDVPVVALGGLSAQDLERAWAHGATAVAGIRQLC